MDRSIATKALTVRHVAPSVTSEDISANATRENTKAEILAVSRESRRVVSISDQAARSRPKIDTIPENPVIVMASCAYSGSKSV